MWLVYAFGSAIFAGLTAVLAKIGIKNVDSTLTTALRTIVVLVFAWAMVFVVGSGGQIAHLSGKTWIFLGLSGVATGVSWLCYFKALQLGDINKVTPIDKSSVILAMLLAFIFLGESLTLMKVVSMVFIGFGTYIMIERKSWSKTKSMQGKGWFFYAALSAVSAAVVAILGKIGMQGVESNLGTAIRTVVVLFLAWGMVYATREQRKIRQIDRKSGLFIALSGVATGASWLCYFKALQEGPASVVVPVDKLSIGFTVLFSFVLFREKLTAKSILGLFIIISGTLLLL